MSSGEDKEIRIGLLTLIGEPFKIEKKKHVKNYQYYEWYCHVKCDCGVEKNVRVNALISGNTRSCGSRIHRCGPSSPLYKGDNVLDITIFKRGHDIAQRLFPLGPCEKCGKAGILRHHIDENTLNNISENIMILCRGCHNTIHHRCIKFCRICGDESRHLCHRRCDKCWKYLKRTGYERTRLLEARAAKLKRESEDLSDK